MKLSDHRITMSILSRLKNRLQDPVFHETKIREFDECMSHLKNENVELHKRLDQLEAMYKTNSHLPQSRILEEHIRKLEAENGRLFEENQYQRQEYERFLDQLATMVIQTAIMQEHIRKECESIYHVIERLANSKINPMQINYPLEGIKEARKRILNHSTKVSNELFLLSSSSSSSHRSISTPESWTRALSLEKEESNPQVIEEKEKSILQRSETFIVAKKPSEEVPSSSLPIRGNDHHPIPLRPSRLPCPCPTSNSRVSKLPIRTTTSSNPSQLPTKKSNIPTPIGSRTKMISNKNPTSVPPPQLNSIQYLKPPVEIIEEQPSMNKFFPLIGDEGYSTWSSMDVKTWLDTTTPVKEAEMESSDPSSILSRLSNKDISLDSLDSSHSSSSSSSSSASFTFSRSETFEKLVLTPRLEDELVDSTSSASSTFNMSDYIEDHFLDQDDNTSEHSSSFETAIIKKNLSFKPQKRLLFPGLLNRLIFYRRFLSDSDLHRKQFYINENHDHHSHVYHSNIINEHSVEVNLVNTYGSDTELHVWSHDCAEQRRFLDERQRQQQNEENPTEQIVTEQQILLQQISEYPWLLQEYDLDRTNQILPSINSPTTDLIVPLHNPDFYQLCALTNSSSFVLSSNPTSSTTASI